MRAANFKEHINVIPYLQIETKRRAVSAILMQFSSHDRNQLFNKCNEQNN